MKKGGRDVCAFSSCFFSLRDKAEIIKMEAMRGRKRVNEIREGELTRMRVNDEEKNELFISSFVHIDLLIVSIRCARDTLSCENGRLRIKIPTHANQINILRCHPISTHNCLPCQFASLANIRKLSLSLIKYR